jgi:TRAP-type C4-dicarboxylate transport system substrate-binding protein
MRLTGLYNPLLKAINALPINISPSDIFTGLQRGVVDGIAWPKGSIDKYGWQKFLKYRVSPNFYGRTFFVIMNKKKYDSLSGAHKKLIAKFVRSYEKKSDELFREKFVIDEAKLESAGVVAIKQSSESPPEHRLLCEMGAE